MKFISVFVALLHLHALQAQSGNFSQIEGVIDRLYQLKNLTMPTRLFEYPLPSMLRNKKCCMPVFTDLLMKALDQVPAEHQNIAEEIRDMMPVQATVTDSDECKERCKTREKMTSAPFKPFYLNLQDLMRNLPSGDFEKQQQTFPK